MSSTVFRRKVVSVLLVLCLVISLLPINSVVNSASTATVTVYHEDFANGRGAATQAGGASLTPVSDKAFDGNSDGKALYVSGRANNWDGVDFNFTDVGMENGKTYTITVNGFVDADADVPSGSQVFLQNVSSYGWIAGANITTGAALTITGTYTVDTSKDNAVRVQTNDEGKAVPFYIGDVRITTTATETVVLHEEFTNGSGKASQAGGASLTPVSDKTFDGNADGKALYVSGRANNWDGVDFNFTDVGMENGKTYNITVKGFVDADADVPAGSQVFLQNVSSYGWIAGANVTTGAAFTVTGSYTVDTSKDNAVRVQSNDEGKAVPFYIGDVMITTIGSGTQPPEDPPRDPAIPFNTITFEDQTTGGFGGRAGTETLTVTNEANHTEGGSYALKVEGRTTTWHGPSLRVEKYIDKGVEYKVTAWVKLLSPESSQLQLSTQVGNGSGAAYNTLSAKTIGSAEGWVMYEGMYRYNNVSSEYLTIYVESSNNATASFYIDDISFVPTSSGPIDIQKDLLPIKTAYQNDFLIGNAISAEDLDGVRLELMKMHNNVATAGNAMKPDALQPTKGNFTFDAADTMVNKVLAEGMQMHGHVLVWHQQSPKWMNTKTEDNTTVVLGRDEALVNMRTHIKNVMEHFGDKVISWDVVNEAMNDNPPNPADWQGSLRTSEWYQAIGPDYVEQAFLAAREVLDVHPDWDIKLYYNDYNEDNQSKSKAIYNMVKEINDRYAETHPGKLLIDGVGMQAHYSLSTNPTNVQLSLERFIELGVEVSITELDIQAGSNSQLSPKLEEAQGYLYAQLFKIFKAHSDKIARVTIWGMDDATSWRASSNPLVFDKNLQAKLAYYGILNPDKYMSEHQPTTPATAKQSTAAYGTPVVDGTIDPIWSKTREMPINQYQMAWQGATGTAKALWDDKNLYVLVQVSDAELDKTSPDAYQEDSTEIFVDENNGKTSFYQEDDGQYRVNFDNEVTFNPSGIESGFVSAVQISGTNYTVEMKIPFKTISVDNNEKIGFDAQINDAKNGARQSVTTWNDTSGNGYQDTSVYGVLTLIGKGNSGNGGNQPGNGSGSGSGSSNSSGSSSDTSSSNNTTKIEKSEIKVKLPTAVKADGTAAVSVSAKVVDDIIRNIGNVKGSDEKLTITLSLGLEADAKAAEVKLPDGTLNKILAADKDTSLKMDAGICQVVFDSRTIEAISKAGTGEVEVKASKVDAAEIAKLPATAAGKIKDHPVYEFSVSVGGKTVSDFGDGTITVSIPYTLGEDEDPNAILVYYIDSNKNLIPVRGTYVNGNVNFKTSHFSKYAISYNKVSFKDVKETDEYYSAVTYLGARDIITGINFEPTRKLTRGEAIVMLLKAYNIQPLDNPQNNFSDVDGEFAGYFAKAREIGMTNGVGNNKLGVDSDITREALYTMMYNMKNYLGELPDKKVKEYRGFGDSNKISSWSLETITKLVEAGLMKDGSYRQLKPKSTCSRADFANILYSLLSKNSIN